MTRDSNVPGGGVGRQIESANLVFKDAVLDNLAQSVNIAQFVSFAPGEHPEHRFAWICGYPPNHRFASWQEAVTALFESSPERSVNVRSFEPGDPKGHDFVYGLTSIEQAMAEVRRLSVEGLYVIVNETIDIKDGGVSGVALGGVLEIAPGDTPRAVEKPGTLALPFDWGMRLLETVYRFRPPLEARPDVRAEFSVHPLRRGYRREHTIIWEVERVAPVSLHADVVWPNRFSRLIGDKAFGLLVAHLLELPVPSTTVIPRGLPPFSFGIPTNTGETWIRTCPVEQVPGRFTTHHGWLDPFALLCHEDREGQEIASVLAQEGVDARYSGALVTGDSNRPILEGVRGSGEQFMLGRAAPERIPDSVSGAVLDLYAQARAELGPVRFEWAYDGRRAWILQLHRGVSATSQRTIYSGEAQVYHRFDVARGIEALRELVGEIEGTGEGVVLVGNIGITSHLGDILRRARIPSRLEPLAEA